MMELDSTTQICAGHLKENKGSIVNISLYAKKKFAFLFIPFSHVPKIHAEGIPADHWCKFQCQNIIIHQDIFLLELFRSDNYAVVMARQSTRD